MLKPICFIATVVAIVSAVSLPSIAAAKISPYTIKPATHQSMTTKTVTLSVSDMTCRVCPITVKKALKSVKGVSKVSVNFNAKTATVTFDTNQTNVSGVF